MKGNNMDKSKSFRVADGVIRNGQLIKDSHANMARAGAPKAVTVPALAYGQTRQTQGTLSPLHHGVAIQDEPMTTKSGHTGKAVPIHNGMNTKTPEARGADYGPDHGSKILGDAGPGSWRSEAHGSARLKR
jgi:hypothetical protein